MTPCVVLVARLKDVDHIKGLPDPAPSYMTPTVRRVELSIEPVLWAITYPVNPHDPIGWIRRCRDGFHAKLESEPLGTYRTGDDAAVAVWERFLERVRVEHDIASRTHGSNDRSGRRQ